MIMGAIYHYVLPPLEWRGFEAFPMPVGNR